MRRVRCRAGNEPCGGRCIPKDYVCASEMPEKSSLKPVDVTAEKFLRTKDLATDKDPILNRNLVTNESAIRKLDARQAQAYALAGGEKQYKKELEGFLIKDSGGNMPALIARDVMRFLAPNIIVSDDLNYYLTRKQKGAYEKQIYRKDRSKFKMSDMLRAGDTLEHGDVIRVRFNSDFIAGLKLFYQYSYYTTAETPAI